MYNSRLENVREGSSELTKSASFLRVVSSDTAVETLTRIENLSVKASTFLEVARQNPGQAADLASKMEPNAAAELFETAVKLFKNSPQVADLLLRMDPHDAANITERIKPVRAATVLDELVQLHAEQTCLILKAMEPRTAGRRAERMSESRLSAVLSRMDAHDASKVAENMDPARVAKVLDQADLETRADLLAQIHEKAALEIISKMDPTKVEEVIEEKGPGALGRKRSSGDATAFEGMKPKKAVEQLEAMKAQNAAHVLMHIHGDVALARFVEMKTNKAAEVAAALESETAARWFEGVVPEHLKKVTAILEIIVNDDPHKAAIIVDVMKRERSASVMAVMKPERAALVCEQLDERTIGELFECMPLEQSTRIWKAIKEEKAIDIILHLDERDRKGKELATNLLTCANLISVEASTSRLTVVKDRLKVGLGALLSTIITGAIDQAQIVGQQGGINHIVLDSFLGGLTGTLLVGNFYFRAAQRLRAPNVIPFIGGKTIASSPNTYQITNAMLWASIGTTAQMVIMHYL